MPRHPGEVLPTCTFYNMQTDLSLGFENRSVVNLPQILPLHSEKNPGSAVLDRLPKKRENLNKFSLPKGRNQHTMAKGE